MSTIANPSGSSLSCHRVYTYTVPPEIISLIVEEFALPTYIVTRNNNGKKVKDPLPLPPPLRPILCKIRLLSKSFNDAASRLLFRRMVSKSGPLHFAFLRTIINSPHLAKYVRIYHTPTADVRSGHVYGRIKKCLPLMTGLQELVYRKLEIPRDLSRSKPLPRHLPKVKKGKNMPFRLRSFVWFSERTRPDEDVQALEFIATQASMQYLRWDSTGPLPSIHKDTIPQNLLYLDASVDTIVTILPGRPSIEGIRWRSHDRAILDHYSTADINELIRKLCRMEQFHRLSFISLAGNYERSALKYLREQNAEPFPQLTTLALLTIDSSIDVNLRRLFPALRELYFPAESAMQHFENVIHEQAPNKVRKLFTSHRGLRYVDLRVNDREPLGWDRFRGWTRGNREDDKWIMSPEYKFYKLLYDPEDRVLDEYYSACPP